MCISNLSDDLGSGESHDEFADWTKALNLTEVSNQTHKFFHAVESNVRQPFSTAISPSTLTDKKNC